VALTCAEPPGEAAHWTGRAMARLAGISPASVPRIWAEHRLQPHRLRTFKRSRGDTAFAAKLRDTVGPRGEPPAHARSATPTLDTLGWRPRPRCCAWPGPAHRVVSSAHI
jgi:hypothetical protein